MFIYDSLPRRKYYQTAVKMHYEEGLSCGKIAKILPVGKTTVCRWIANFAKDNPQIAPIGMKSRLQKHETKVSPERKKGQPSEVEELQAEIARLQKELRHEKLRADAYDKMIDQAETAFKIPIRKKSGAGQ